MIRVLINGGAFELDEATSVAGLLRLLQREGVGIAVALNQECLRRDEYETSFLKANDEVEILSPHQGG